MTSFASNFLVAIAFIQTGFFVLFCLFVFIYLFILFFFFFWGGGVPHSCTMQPHSGSLEKMNSGDMNEFSQFFFVLKCFKRRNLVWDGFFIFTITLSPCDHPCHFYFQLGYPRELNCPKK